MNISLPSETIFHAIESTIKEYRKFALKNISASIPDMTIDQSMVLIFLKEHPELTQKEIAELVFKDNASMTRMINTMVEKKYLKRSINNDDRRRFKLALTAKAEEVLEKLPPIINRNRAASLSGINKEEIHQLKLILNKIKSNCKHHEYIENS
ncbi:MAG: MarR family transcriptional regulator [Bacteroidota bacterium]